ncbi:hypothetical protein HQ585_06440 [candidate division KSB1 bacterium]|nr:hypothetical protein [candidate division KSB1 bacterium]
MSKQKQFISLVVMVGLILTAPLFSQGFSDQLNIHGFVSQGYLKTTENNYLASDSKEGCMSYSEATINFMTSPVDRLNIGTQLYARDMDEDGNLFVTIDWAYGDYRWKDYMGFRIGRFKNPVGLYAKLRDVDMARVPAFLPQSIYAESERDLNLAINGVGLYGNRPISILGDLDYEVVYGGYNIVDQQSSFFKNQYYMTAEPIAMGMMAMPGIISSTLTGTSNELSTIENVRGIDLRWNTPVPGLLLGSSINQLEFLWNYDANIDMVFPTADPASPYTMSQAVPIAGAYDIRTKIFFGEFQWNKLTVAGEYRTFDIEGDIVIGTTESHTKTPREMYYGMGTYQVNHRIAFSTYYSVFYANSDDKEGADQVVLGRPDHSAWQKDLCFTGRLDINDNWLFKAEYHMINGTGQVQGLHNPDGLKEDWSLLVLKSSFNF